MAVSAKALFRGAATTTTTTTLYTVPTTGTTTTVTSIVVTNTGGSAYTFTLTLDGVDLFTTTAIAANSTAIFDMKQVLPANATPKTIKGGASNTAVNFHISGVEVA
jgi:hypothetical protein